VKARPQRGTAKAGRHAFSARSIFLTIRDALFDVKCQRVDFVPSDIAHDQRRVRRIKADPLAPPAPSAYTFQRNHELGLAARNPDSVNSCIA
jgi:hypothetical protein